MEKLTKTGAKRKEPFGRPTIFSQKIADEICSEIEISSSSIEKILDGNKNWPCLKTYYTWLNKHPDFLHAVTRAKKIGCETMEDSLIKIAEDYSDDFFHNGKLKCVNTAKIQRDNLRIQTIQKILGYRNREKYGNTSQVKVEGAVFTSQGLTTKQLKEQAKALFNADE